MRPSTNYILGEDCGQAALLPAEIEDKRARSFWNGRP
jgi:hypothetical protein